MGSFDKVQVVKVDFYWDLSDGDTDSISLQFSDIECAVDDLENFGLISIVKGEGDPESWQFKVLAGEGIADYIKTSMCHSSLESLTESLKHYMTQALEVAGKMKEDPEYKKIKDQADV